MKFSKDLSYLDKYLVLYNAIPKLVRGVLRAPFFKHHRGVQYIGRHVQISYASRISCGRNVKFEDYAEVHGLASQGLTFSDGVTIGRGVMIRPSSYYGGDVGQGLTIGANSSIGPHAYVGCSGFIKIGKNVMFGPKCSLFAENHIFSDVNTSIRDQGVSQKGITVGDNCWIGSNVIILDGVEIGAGSVIGAGTLVTKNVAPNSKLIDRRNSVQSSRLE